MNIFELRDDNDEQQQQQQQQTTTRVKRNVFPFFFFLNKEKIEYVTKRRWWGKRSARARVSEGESQKQAE